MRTREEIAHQAVWMTDVEGKDYRLLDEEEKLGVDVGLILEVLLDIRDLLEADKCKNHD